jgi:hypothetical protein
MYEYGTFAPDEWETVPAGYLIPAELDEIIIRLQAHGIRMEPRAVAPGSVEAEAFQIDSLTTAERVFQGHNEQTLFGRYEPREVSVSEGAWWVPADQPLGRLVFMLLEPRSDDGFAAWGFLADHIEAGGTYPIVRFREGTP